MNTLLAAFVANACLIMLHELESAYLKEWQILKLPGGITGFVWLHVPILVFLFWGALEVSRQTVAGSVIALIAGAGGLAPFIVHKWLLKKPGYFESLSSNLIIYLNVLAGLALMATGFIRLLEQT